MLQRCECHLAGVTAVDVPPGGCGWFEDLRGYGVRGFAAEEVEDYGGAAGHCEGTTGGAGAGAAGYGEGVGVGCGVCEREMEGEGEG